MAVSYSVASFIADVKRKGRFPSQGQASFSDQDIVDFLNEEVEIDVSPFLVKMGEEYLTTTLTTTLTAGVSVYGIPSDAVGSKLRLVQFAADGVSFLPFERIEPEREGLLMNSTSPRGFKVEGTNLVVLPTTASMVGSLKITYFKRPVHATIGGNIDSVIPLEVLPYLVQRVVFRLKESTGDPKAEGFLAVADRTKAALVDVLTSRTEGNTRVVINRNGPGWGRNRRGY